MEDSYERIRTTHGPAFVRRSACSRLGRADAIVFDCDGVLIDSRSSYDATIGVTLERLFSEMFRVRLPWRQRAAPLIHRLRRTGGFNNDWDTTYALALFGSCSLPETCLRRAGKDPGTRRPARLSDREVAATFSRIARLVKRFEGYRDRAGRASVERFLQGSVTKEARVICDFVGEKTGYPGSPPSSLLATVFDEIYHGPTLFKEMYGIEPRYCRRVGLIEREKVLLTRPDLVLVHQMFDGRLALATGRPRRATEHTLGKFMPYFRPEASVFIGDADLPLPDAERLGAFRKPSGLALIHARDALGSEGLLYVGDSAEDLKMARNARRAGGEVSFVATYGISYDARDQVDFFREGRAELILPTVSDVAGALKELA